MENPSKIQCEMTLMYKSYCQTILLCSAFELLDFLLMDLQSLVRPLTSVDIVGHTTGYTWALRGLCQQSNKKKKKKDK